MLFDGARCNDFSSGVEPFCHFLLHLDFTCQCANKVLDNINHIVNVALEKLCELNDSLDGLVLSHRYYDVFLVMPFHGNILPMLATGVTCEQLHF